MVVLPGTPDSIAAEVPADLVWDFRIRSLGSLVLLWAGLGLGLGWLLERDGAIVPDDDRALASASP
jgi:predicted cobalt transporter CbtA